jgi:hypothetical protein
MLDINKRTFDQNALNSTPIRAISIILGGGCKFTKKASMTCAKHQKATSIKTKSATLHPTLNQKGQGLILGKVANHRANFKKSYSLSKSSLASNHIALMMPKAQASKTPKIQAKYHIITLL